MSEPAIMFPLHYAVLIVSAGIGVSALEDLRAFAVFRADGLLSWNIAKLRARWTSSGPASRMLDRLLDGGRFRALLVGILGTALLAPMTLLYPDLLLLVVVLLLGAVILTSIRSLYGLDGSDQMSLIILSAALVAVVVPYGGVAWHVAHWFVAVQLALSYTIAGSAKLLSRQWRNGTALVGIMSTDSYGNEAMYRWLRRRPLIAGGMSWSVILLETLFGLMFVLPPGPRLLLLGAMFAFHLGCAVLMGLNNFFFAFVATYPVLWMCTEISYAAITR